MGEPWFEVAFGEHYSEIYGHRNEAEARQCLQLLPSLAPLILGDLNVLDLGCGDGRHLSTLKKSGVEAVGLDLSSALLAKAGDRADKSPLVRGDMRFLPFESRSFGSVLSLFTAFGYFGPLKDNLPMVQEVARVLSPGGHWFLDYFNCDNVRRELGSGEEFRRERIIRGMRITETRKFSESDAMVFKDVTLESISGVDSPMTLPPGGLQYTEKVAVFALDEIDELAGEQGFIRTASAGSYTGCSLDTGDRWILVYRKEQC